MMTIKLEGKEYQIDIEQAKELGLLKEKDNRVKSWEEFKLKYSNEVGHYTAAQLTVEEAKAFTAFSKLLKLRRDWIGEWKPDWESNYYKFTIYVSCNKLLVCSRISTSTSLSFPTEQMAREFLETFHDLIEEAKILI